LLANHVCFHQLGACLSASRNLCRDSRMPPLRRLLGTSHNDGS
jgi:hypothetical protein